MVLIICKISSIVFDCPDKKSHSSLATNVSSVEKNFEKLIIELKKTSFIITCWSIRCWVKWKSHIKRNVFIREFLI